MIDIYFIGVAHWPTKGLQMKLFSLKTKIGLAVSGLITVLIVLMALYALFYFRTVYREAMIKQEVLLVDSMARQIEDKLDSVQSALIASSNGVTSEMISDPEKAQTFLDSKTGLMTMFDNHIFLFAVSGEIIAEAPYQPGRRGMNFSHREYIQRTIQTRAPVVGTPYISSQIHSDPAVMLTVPIYNGNGEMIAIMAGGLDLMKDNFLGGLPYVKIGNGGYFYMFNSNRVMIIHPESSRILKQDIPLGANELYDQSIAGYDVAGENVNSVGIRIMSTFKHLRNSDWILAANHPLEEIYAPFRQAERFAMFSIPLWIILLIFIVWSLVRKMTMPLVLLTKHMEESSLKRGQERFSTIFPNDEIGALSTAFNKMLYEIDTKTESVEKSEELYRTMTEFGSDMVFWLSPENTVLYISPNCERITGFCDREFYRRPQLIEDIVYEEDRLKWLAYISRTERLDVESLEFRIITHAGNVCWIICISRLMFKENNEFYGLRGSYLDITDRKIAEEKLQQANESLEFNVEERTRELSSMNQELIAMNEEMQMEITERQRMERELTQAIEHLKLIQAHLIQSEKMAALGNLVAGVAHEINTPVGVSITASSHLEQVTREFLALCKHGAPLRQDLIDYLEIIQESSAIITKNLERAGKMVQSFKQVSVDQSNEVQRVFNIKQYLEEILLSMNPTLKKNKHSITIECDETLTIKGFPGALAQVITNLVMNSLIHGYGPDDQGNMRIAVYKEDQNVAILYSDDGKGMGPKVVARIFDPFFTTKRGMGGTGLGLHIVYNIITQKLKGEITCESVPGQGTTFRIFLPLKHNIETA